MYEVEIVQQDGKYLILNTNYGRKTCYSIDEVIAHLKNLQAKYGKVKFYYDNNKPTTLTEITVDVADDFSRHIHRICNVKDFVTVLTNKEKRITLSVILQIFNHYTDDSTCMTKDLQQVFLLASKMDSHIRYGNLRPTGWSCFKKIKTI